MKRLSTEFRSLQLFSSGRLRRKNPPLADGEDEGARPPRAPPLVVDMVISQEALLEDGRGQAATVLGGYNAIRVLGVHGRRRWHPLRPVAHEHLGARPGLGARYCDLPVGEPSGTYSTAKRAPAERSLRPGRPAGMALHLLALLVDRLSPSGSLGATPRPTRRQRPLDARGPLQPARRSDRSGPAARTSTGGCRPTPPRRTSSLPEATRHRPGMLSRTPGGRGRRPWLMPAPARPGAARPPDRGRTTRGGPRRLGLGRSTGRWRSSQEVRGSWTCDCPTPATGSGRPPPTAGNYFFDLLAGVQMTS